MKPRNGINIDTFLFQGHVMNGHPRVTARYEHQLNIHALLIRIKDGD